MTETLTGTRLTDWYIQISEKAEQVKRRTKATGIT